LRQQISTTTSTHERTKEGSVQHWTLDKRTRSIELGAHSPPATTTAHTSPTMSVDYLLHESSVGYAIFSVKLQADTVGARLKEVQEAHTDLAKFGKMVQLVSGGQPA
jgi:hypothetical protein